MRSLSRLALLSGTVAVFLSPQAFAQGLKINPYPVSPDEQVNPYNLDQAVVRDLLARQKERQRAAAAANQAPVSVMAQPVAEAAESVLVVDPVEETVEAVQTDIAIQEAAPVVKAVEPIDVIAPPVLQAEPEMVPPVKVVPVQDVAEIASQPAPSELARTVQTSFDRPAVSPGAPALDHVTVIVAPRSAPAMQPPLSVVSAPVQQVVAPPVVAETKPMLPEPAAQLPVMEKAPDEIVNRMTAQTALEDVQQRVTAMDDETEASTPALLQEQALMRGIQAQSGAMVADDVDAQALLAKIEPQPKARTSEQGQALLEEADAILEQQIASARDNMPEALPGGLQMPASVPEDEALDHGNKIIYNEENIKEVMQALTPMPQEETMVPPVKAVRVGEAEADDKPIYLQDKDREEYWQAASGESAYEVLKQWSKEANVDLIWNSQFLVDVKESLYVSGEFEDAVITLLDQYTGLKAGVEGVLYFDKTSGRKTLVINTNGQG